MRQGQSIQHKPTSRSAKRRPTSRSDRRALASVSPLHIASFSGDVDAVQGLLVQGSDVSTPDGFKLTPLHYAARAGHTAVARILVGAGANMLARDEERWTPVHDAARYGQDFVLRLLLTAGANATARDAHGATPLDVARMWDQPYTVRTLEEWTGQRRQLGTETLGADTVAGTEPIAESEPPIDTKSGRREARPAGTRQRGPGTVDETLAQIAALLGTGAATVDRLAASQVRTLAQAGELTVAQLARAAGLPLGAASELAGAVARAREMLERIGASGGDGAGERRTNCDLLLAPGHAAAWRLRRLVCAEVMEPTLVSLLDHLHTRACEALLPATVARSYPTLATDACSCGTRDAAAAVLLSEAIYSLASLSRLRQADLERVGLRSDAAAALCAAVRQSRQMARLATPIDRPRWLPSSAPSSLGPPSGRGEAGGEAGEGSGRAGRAASSRGGATGGQQPKQATRHAGRAECASAVVHLCRSCGREFESPSGLQRHADERRQYGTCARAEQLIALRDAVTLLAATQQKTSRSRGALANRHPAVHGGLKRPASAPHAHSRGAESNPASQGAPAGRRLSTHEFLAHTMAAAAPAPSASAGARPPPAAAQAAPAGTSSTGGKAGRAAPEGTRRVSAVAFLASLPELPAVAAGEADAPRPTTAAAFLAYVAPTREADAGPSAEASGEANESAAAFFASTEVETDAPSEARRVLRPPPSPDRLSRGHSSLDSDTDSKHSSPRRSELRMG